MLNVRSASNHSGPPGVVARWRPDLPGLLGGDTAEQSTNVQRRQVVAAWLSAIRHLYGDEVLAAAAGRRPLLNPTGLGRRVWS